MKSHPWQMVTFLGLLLAAAAATGQSNPAILKADIPFPFVVANHTLPAGHYQLSTTIDQTIRIANSNNQGARTDPQIVRKQNRTELRSF